MLRRSFSKAPQAEESGDPPMYRRSISAVLSLVLVATMAQPAAANNSNHLGSSSLAAGKSTGFTVPISGATDAEGTFTGSLRILRFAVQNGKLVASGIVTGTLVDENGISTAWLLYTSPSPRDS